MTDDPKRRAQERLAAMVDDAADVVEDDIKGRMPYLRGSTRVASAWKALEHVLGSTSIAPSNAPNAEGVTPADDLAARRQALQQALRQKRADKP